MRPIPSRDAVDFAAALVLGAAIGWSVVTVLREQDRKPPPSRRLRRLREGRHRRAGGQSSFLRELKAEAGRLARSAGQELAQTTLYRLGGALVDARNSGGR